MRMRGHEDEAYEAPAPPSFPPPSRSQRTASPCALSSHSSGYLSEERVLYPPQAPPSARPVAFPPERHVAYPSERPVAYPPERPVAYPLERSVSNVPSERTGYSYVAQPRDNARPVATDYCPPRSNAYALAGSARERGGSVQSSMMGSTIKSVTPEPDRLPRANSNQQVASEFHRAPANTRQYPSSSGSLPPARDFIRPPKYGGHSKRDQLGSIAESWGPDQSDSLRTGLFQHPPSPPSSPSYGGRARPNRW